MERDYIFNDQAYSDTVMNWKAQQIKRGKGNKFQTALSNKWTKSSTHTHTPPESEIKRQCLLQKNHGKKIVKSHFVQVKIICQ